MSRAGNKRERLVDAAKSLIHRQGFARTTLADIAHESAVPVGNVYYYFKTKEELAGAVIAQHLEEFRAYARECETAATPQECLGRMLELPLGYADEIAEFGCPVGSLAQELAKGEGRSALADRIDDTLREKLDWVINQFRRMGRDDAGELGMEVFATVQGSMELTYALHDPKVIKTQIRRLREWLAGL